jgi:hypothetical protein
MAENKTQATNADVIAFIEGVADETQRADAHAIVEIMTRLSGEPAKMWGPSIIGFGSYHYKYDSGREGDSLRIGFSPRKGQTVLYLVDGYVGKEAQLARLGKHKLGKSCLYIKRLSDVDMAVLEDMITGSLTYIRAKSGPAANQRPLDPRDIMPLHHRPIALPLLGDEPLTRPRGIIKHHNRACRHPVKQALRLAAHLGINRPWRAVNQQQVDRIRHTIQIIPKIRPAA